MKTMSKESALLWYLVLVCVASVLLSVHQGGKALIAAYYYHNPEAGLNPVYTMEYNLSAKPVKLPEGLQEEKSEQQKLSEIEQMYKDDLAQYLYNLADIARRNATFSVLFLFLFLSHLLILFRTIKRKDSAT